MQNLSLALQITLVGMGAVFAAIVLMWGVMAVLVRLTPEVAEAADAAPTPALPDSNADDALRRRAAIAAVGVALALRAADDVPHVPPEPPTAFVSAWQAVTRANQLNPQRPKRS
jgi:Na+-transporting methylmalonyl-CoA/oxaloacetate decarboxylase gamma subunit